MTECKTDRIQFHALGSREVQGQFDGGDISSDAGGLLLREVEKRTGILKRFAGCFQDHRDPRFVEHRIEPLVAQRVYGLFADRTSTATMRANQLRLYFSSVAYMLMQALRRLGLQGTEFARAHCTTIRLKLLKIGAQIHVTVRRVWIRMAGGYPYDNVFAQIYANLQNIPLALLNKGLARTSRPSGLGRDSCL